MQHQILYLCLINCTNVGVCGCKSIKVHNVKISLNYLKYGHESWHHCAALSVSV